MLYIVATPIGNMKDITYRAVEVLKEVDLIAAEDTRNTGILLKHYDIVTPMTSYHEHNELAKAKKLIEELQLGKNIALVSDAGTPGICDPGYRIVSMAREEGIDVQVVPGPCAVITALSGSGLPTDQFHFFGFFPPKSGARRRKLEALKELSGTHIFYESPHRIEKTVQDIAEILPQARVMIARELTKKFEEVLSGTAQELLDQGLVQKIKGELVVLLGVRS